MLPGLTSYDAIADRVTEVGRNIAAGGHNDAARSAIEDPPTGVDFPIDYSVTAKECAEALARAFQRVPRQEPESDRQLLIDRGEEVLSRLRAPILNGNPGAARVATSMFSLFARVQGLGAPQTVDSSRKGGRPVLDETEDLSRWTQEDQMMVSALMNKLRGGPSLGIKTPGELRDEGSYALLEQLGFKTWSYKSSERTSGAK